MNACVCLWPSMQSNALQTALSVADCNSGSGKTETCLLISAIAITLIVASVTAPDTPLISDMSPLAARPEIVKCVQTCIIGSSPINHNVQRSYTHLQVCCLKNVVQINALSYGEESTQERL